MKYMATWRLKAGKVRGMDPAIARQWFSKQIDAATDTNEVIQDVAFFYATRAEANDDRMGKTCCALISFV
jgi:L-serine deaminase